MREVGPDMHLWCRRGKGRAKVKVCDYEDQEVRFGHGEMGLREQKRRSPMRKDVISVAVSSCSEPRLIHSPPVSIDCQSIKPVPSITSSSPTSKPSSRS